MGRPLKSAAAALLTGLCTLCGALAAEEVWSGLDQGLWRIYSSASDGEPLPMQGVGPGSDLAAPALSPDGARVAVEAAGRGVAVCPVDGGTCTPLRDLPGVAGRPAWNPRTGDLLFALYTVDASSEDADIWAVDTDLENPGPLIIQTGNQDDPDVSPDGRMLVYSSGQTVLLRRAAPRVVRHLWTMDLVTGRASPLAPAAFQDQHPDWSPDGEQIAFASDRSGQFEIWVVAARGGEPRLVTSGEGSKTWPAWSPDGLSILFTWARGGQYTLGIVDAGGSGPRPHVPAGATDGRQMRDADWR